MEVLIPTGFRFIKKLNVSYLREVFLFYIVSTITSDTYGYCYEAELCLVETYQDQSNELGTNILVIFSDSTKKRTC